LLDFGDLNGSKLVQDPLKVVGREAPNRFKWVLDRFAGSFKRTPAS